MSLHDIRHITLPITHFAHHSFFRLILGNGTRTHIWSYSDQTSFVAWPTGSYSLTTLSEMDSFELLELPRPLVEDILLLAIDAARRRPSDVFVLNHDIYEFLRPKYLKSIRLTSIEQVKAFAESEGIVKYGKEVKSIK